jgi:ribosomal protein L29
MTNEFQEQTKEQLNKVVGDLREKIRTIRFGGAGSRSRNVRERRGVRRDVARALTELRARDIAAMPKKA